MKKSYTTPTVNYCIYADICAPEIPELISIPADWNDALVDEED